MKIVCDSCQAKYFVADDKIHKRVVRLTCQRCGHVIVARRDKNQGAGAAQLRERLGLGMSSSARSQPASSSDAAGVGDTADWYFSRDGQSFGPFSQADLMGRFESGELGPECYVWHRDLGDWLAAHSTEPFAGIIARKQRAEVPPLPSNPFANDDATVPDKGSSIQSQRPGARVQSLKERLGAIGGHDASQAPDTSEDEVVELTEATARSEAGDATEVEDAEVLESMDEIDLDVDGASRVVSINEIMGAAKRPKSASKPEGEEWLTEEQSAARDSLNKAMDQARQSMPDGAPVERSMLIHIDHLRQQNRRVKWYAIGAVAAVALLGVGIWLFIQNTQTDLEGEESWEPGSALAAMSGDEISDEELERIAPLEEFTMVTAEDDATLEASAEAAESPLPPRRRRIGEKKPPKRKRIGEDDVEEIAAAMDVDADVGKQDVTDTGKPKTGLGLGGSETPALKPSSGDSSPSSYKGLTTRRRRSGVDLAGDGGSIGAELETSKSSKYAGNMGRKVKASERNRFVSGLKKVSRGVQECHKRQLKKGPLPVKKVYIVLTVEPNGKVSRVKVDKAVRGTRFASCLNSKQDRWKFEKFDGKAVQLRQGFVLE